MNESTVQKAVIYCRVSGTKQVREGDGLASQETRCREFAKYKGYEVVKVFTDDLTGKIAERPGMIEMMDYIEQHRKDALVAIIDDISRLARDVIAHWDLRSSIDAVGGKLESPSIEFGDDPDSILVENLLASVSQHQREKNAEQTKNRMRGRVMNGYWVFAAPVGYRYQNVSGHGKILVRDEPHAGIIQEVLEGFASGRFQTQIEATRFLVSYNIIKPYRSGNISRQRIKDILTHPLYAGYLDRPDWNIHLIKGKHEPLISFETFKTIQDKLKSTANIPARKDIHADFPLRGFVTCACCDRPMTAGWSKGKYKKYPYYTCHTKDCDCSRKSIRKEKMEADFETLLYQLTPSRHLMMMAANMLKELWTHNIETAQSQSDAMRKELAATDQKVTQYLDRVVKAESETVIAAYEKQIKFLEENKVILQEKIAKCGRPVEDFEDTFRTSLEFLGNPQILWTSEDIEDKRAVLKLVFAEKLPYDRFEGFRTPKTSLPVNMLQEIEDGEVTDLRDR